MTSTLRSCATSRSCARRLSCRQAGHPVPGRLLFAVVTKCRHGLRHAKASWWQPGPQPAGACAGCQYASWLGSGQRMPRLADQWRCNLVLWPARSPSIRPSIQDANWLPNVGCCFLPAGHPGHPHCGEDLVCSRLRSGLPVCSQVSILLRSNTLATVCVLLAGIIAVSRACLVASAFAACSPDPLPQLSLALALQRRPRMPWQKLSRCMGPPLNSPPQRMWRRQQQSCRHSEAVLGR